MTEAAPPPKARTRADKISGVILALTMLAAFALVLRTILAIAGGPLPAGAGGKVLPFETVTPEGKPIKLSEFADQVILVDFWATWCPPCVASMPDLQRLYSTYKDKGFVVIGVNQEAGDEPTVKAFLKEHEISFPIAMDSGMIARDYGVFTFPTSFLINRQGMIHGVWRGPPRESDLRIEIEALLAAKPEAAK